MACMHSSAALIVLGINIIVVVLSVLTNSQINYLIELMDRMGLDTGEVEDLRVKWRWVVLLSIGNIAVWGIINQQG